MSPPLRPRDAAREGVATRTTKASRSRRGRAEHGTNRFALKLRKDCIGINRTKRRSFSLATPNLSNWSETWDGDATGTSAVFAGSAAPVGSGEQAVPMKTTAAADTCCRFVMAFNVSVQPSPHNYNLPKRLSIDAAPTSMQATAVTRRRLAGVLCVVRRELNRRLAWRSTCQPRALEQPPWAFLGRFRRQLPLIAPSPHTAIQTRAHFSGQAPHSRGNTATSPRGELQRPPASLAAAHH